MPKEETLHRVENDIAAGDLGKARERLLGLFRRYPTDFDIRRRLARIYADLQYPEQAGRFWYLEELKTEEMKRACRIFELRYGNDPGNILAALGSNETRAAIDVGFAQRVLADLEQRRLQSGHAPRQPRPSYEPWFAAPGCVLIIIASVFVFAMGVIRIYELWFGPFIRRILSG